MAKFGSVDQETMDDFGKGARIGDIDKLVPSGMQNFLCVLAKDKTETGEKTPHFLLKLACIADDFDKEDWHLSGMFEKFWTTERALPRLAKFVTTVLGKDTKAGDWSLSEDELTFCTFRMMVKHRKFTNAQTGVESTNEEGGLELEAWVPEGDYKAEVDRCINFIKGKIAEAKAKADGEDGDGGDGGEAPAGDGDGGEAPLPF